MKLTAVILLSACLTAGAHGYSQKVSLNATNAPLETVLWQIKNQTGYAVFYNADWLEKANAVTIHLKNADIENALNLVFRNQPLDYRIIHGTIVLELKTKDGALKSKDVAPQTLNPPLLLTVKGRILNENGEVVAATIMEKGTPNGTISDADGYFLLQEVHDDATLVISGVGIITREVKVSGRSDLGIVRVKTKASVEQVVEVVNKGYYSERKRLSTGSIGRVSSKEIERQPVTNPMLALQGRIPGLDIVQQSGVPGSNVTIRIRGTNSLTTGANDPLVLIDGVPFLSNSKNFIPNNWRQQPGGGASPFSSLNPADIESIEVLKDADATAIYGSRGANGVILITTKRGRTGKTKLAANVAYGFGKVSRMMDVLNRRDYLDMRYEALKNDGVDLATATTNVHDLKEWDTTRSTDWQELLLGGTANYANAQVGLSGGTSNNSFGISGGYWRETTVYPGDFSNTKGSVRFNYNHTSLNDRLRAQLTGTFFSEENNLPQGDFVHEATTLPPVAPPVFTSEGTLNWVGTTFTNPFAALYKSHEARSNGINMQSLISYRIIDGLELKTTLGYSTLRYESKYLVPETSINPIHFIGPQNRIAEFGDNTTKTWNIEPQLTYNTTLAGNKFSLLLGSTFQHTQQEGELNFGSGFADDALLRNKSAAQSMSVNYTFSEYKYNSVFFRANYNIADRYIINGVVRRDGSSRFGKSNAFGNFGAIGAAWIFSEEKFIRNGMPFLSFGKLRSSFGVTGSDAIGDYGYLSLYRSAGNGYPYYGLNGVGIEPAGLSNNNYQWETNTKFDIALELGFFDNRVSISANYYRNRSGNQLVGYPVSTVTGFSTVPLNLPAIVQNTGLELELSTVNIENSALSWTTAINFTIPRNKLIDYPGLASSSYANTYVIGQPLTIVKVAPTQGIDPETGTMVYLNKNGEEVRNINSLGAADRTVVINTAKQYYGGISNTITYKQFRLDVLVQVAQNAGLIYNVNGVYVPGYVGNLPQFVYDDRWTGHGSTGTYNKLTQTTSSDAYRARARNTDDAAYDDVFYARLKNVSLSYMLKPAWMSMLRIDNARIYIQGQNLATFTNFKGMDPESPAVSMAPISNVMFGIQLTF